MKTLRKLSFALTAIVFLTVMGCQEKPKRNGEKPPKEEREMAKAPDGIISLGEAKELCDNYEELRIPTILEFETQRNPSEQFIPTQFIDFDLKTIKKYIKYVEHSAKKAKVKPDSLRIYLGNYGKDGRDPNHNTVFIVPTATVKGKHGGFYINDKGKAELIRNYWPNDDSQEMEQKSKAGFLPSMNLNLYQDGSLILNRGHGGPPPTSDF